MPRRYKRSPGSRNYKNYSEATLKLALDEIRQGLISINKASDKYNINKSTLSRKMRGKHASTVGHPTVLNQNEEECLADALILASDWGFPLTQYDVRLIVKGFLDRRGIVERRFKGNLPGVDWVKSFLLRHKNILSERLCQNIKRARASVDATVVDQYFNELEKSLEGVSNDVIVNYDETNMTDDPSRKKVIVRRGCKHPDRIIDHSKSSTSVMFSGSASGVLLPPYVCYRAEHLYDTWTEGGPKGTRYNRSKNGWFNLIVFEDWFFSIAVPYFQKFDDGTPKVLIGDNLSSHISLRVINQCQKLNIRFVLLPPNSTHLCQPLDAAYFRPLKMKWRAALDEWKTKHRGAVQKDCFPRMLKKCLLEMDENNQTVNNLKAGFATTGISPLDRTRVLRKLPGFEEGVASCNSTIQSTADEQSQRVGAVWVETLKDFFEEFRKTETSSNSRKEPQTSKNQPKKKRLKVLPGKSICEEDIEDVLKENLPGPSGMKQIKKKGKKGNKSEDVLVNEEVDLNKTFSTSTPRTKISSDQRKTKEKMQGKKRAYVEDSDSSCVDDHFSVHDMSSDLHVSSTSEDDDQTETTLPENVEKLPDLDLSKDLNTSEFVVVALKYNEGSKKEKTKKFIAQIINKENDVLKVKYLRQSSKATNIYFFPNEDDIGTINREVIANVVVPLFIRRGRYCFPVEM